MRDCGLAALVPIKMCLLQLAPAFNDDFAGRAHAVPARELSLLAFKALVNGKEVLDFAQCMGEHLRVVIDLAVERITFRHGQNLLIAFSLIDHPKHANWPHLNEASRKRRRLQQHQNIKRVAIAAERAGNEAVVTGIMYRGEQRAVQPKYVKLLIVLVFVDRAFWYLDHCIHKLRRMDTDGKASVILHMWTKMLAAAGGCARGRFALCCLSLPLLRSGPGWSTIVSS